MATLPEYLSRAGNVELSGRSVEPWVRRAVLLLFLAISLAALVNVFGQKPESRSTAAGGADLTVSAPDAARGGLIYEVVVRVDAHRELKKPALVFDPGWFQGFTYNTVEPEPLQWAQRNGRNIMDFGKLAAGTSLVVRLQAQVNPTAIGRRDQDLVLEDGTSIAAVSHSITVYP